MKPRTALIVILLFVVFPWVFLWSFFFSIPFSPDRPNENTVPTNSGIQGAINSTIEDIVPGASILLSDAESNIGSSAHPPFEVIVNASASDCFDAKVKLLEIMRSLYTDGDARLNISRVLVNMPGHISASLGSNDGRAVNDETWQSAGPTNFFSILRQSGSAELEGITLANRTWGRGISGCN